MFLLLYVSLSLVGPRVTYMRGKYLVVCEPEALHSLSHTRYLICNTFFQARLYARRLTVEPNFNLQKSPTLALFSKTQS